MFPHKVLCEWTKSWVDPAWGGGISCKVLILILIYSICTEARFSLLEWKAHACCPSLTKSCIAYSIVIWTCTYTGIIVQFLPAFQSTSPKDFYDDKPYWEVGLGIKICVVASVHTNRPHPAVYTHSMPLWSLIVAVWLVYYTACLCVSNLL